MKKISILCLTFLLLITAGFLLAKETSKTGTLTIIVNGFENNNGKAMIALCNSKECYKDTNKAIRREMTGITNQQSKCVIKNLPYGTYSISLYHDENENNELDKNALGIPKEDYGFSNNARSTFGPPDYEDVVFEFNKAEMIVTITVK
ncbi:MAG: DUF2141 domain-containing protein [Spirochaetes bacterium]|nr:DUF2141 domain-containing protein [Spirochaetota bacterium]